MQDAFAHCAELVRSTDHDRFIATLFAPAERRGALHALYAFSYELARVRDVAHAALPGEIRLQWWTDVVDRQRDDEAGANPVAAALLATMERHGLARETLGDLIDARRFDLYDDPMASVADMRLPERDQLFSQPRNHAFGSVIKFRRHGLGQRRYLGNPQFSLQWAQHTGAAVMNIGSRSWRHARQAITNALRRNKFPR